MYVDSDSGRCNVHVCLATADDQFLVV